jgi:hypothetical protein
MRKHTDPLGERASIFHARKRLRLGRRRLRVAPFDCPRIPRAMHATPRAYRSLSPRVGERHEMDAIPLWPGRKAYPGQAHDHDRRAPPSHSGIFARLIRRVCHARRRSSLAAGAGTILAGLAAMSRRIWMIVIGAGASLVALMPAVAEVCRRRCAAPDDLSGRQSRSTHSAAVPPPCLPETAPRGSPGPSSPRQSLNTRLSLLDGRPSRPALLRQPSSIGR